MKLKLFLTYDHELPLGKIRTSYKAALFDPTERVMHIAEKCGVKVTLFTDILCAKRFREWDYSNFYEPYENQLQRALQSGHDVQLHIHPHWLTTEYHNNTFNPSSDFGLSAFRDNTTFGSIEGIIARSIESLGAICKAVNKDYKCIAYRAGGFNIAPETTRIFNALFNEGIRYDSSMINGYYFKSGISEVDFRRLPDLPNWIINPDNYRQAYDKEGITEIPIASIPKTLFETPTMFKMKKLASRAPIAHGEVIHSHTKKDIIAKINMMFSARMLSFDNYTLSLNYLMSILEYNMKRHKTADTLMLSIISHPKSMGDYSFQLMEDFIHEVQLKYPTTEFSTFSALSNEI